MSDFNWDALPDAPSAASAPAVAPQAAAAPIASNGFDWNAMPDASHDDILQAKHGTSVEQLKTIGEGLVSGPTFGFSKGLESPVSEALGFGKVNMADIQGREEANPVESALAKVAGTGALLVGTGGASAALPEGAGMLARIGAGAGEGAVIGGLNQAGDDWSQDKALDAGKIAASAGIGALLGGVGSGVVEGLKAAPEINSKITSLFEKVTGLDKESALMNPNSSGYGSYAEKLKAAYQMSDEHRPTIIKELSKHLQDLHDSATEVVTNPANTAIVPPSYEAANKEFQQAFMNKGRIDTNKVTTFFDSINEPASAEKALAFNNFMVNTQQAIQGQANNFAYQYAIKNVVNDIQKSGLGIVTAQNKAHILEALKQAGEGGHASIWDLILTEVLPKEVVGALLALRRYAMSGGAERAGMDLAKMVATAKTLALHAQKAGNQIDKGAASIFRRTVPAMVPNEK